MVNRHRVVPVIALAVAAGAALAAIGAAAGSPAADNHGTPPSTHHGPQPAEHHGGTPPPRDHHSVPPAGNRDDLHAAKAATARFRDVRAAEAAGYVQGSPCVSSPEGGMGFHWENAALMATDTVSVAHPEILLYAPGPHGLRLVGLEYWKRDADQNLATSGDRPSLFERPFDGPMLGHSPTMPVHYDLHVWIWQDNPTGLFAPFNPTVTC